MLQEPVEASEVVYAIHNFVAENDDEIAFSRGEPVLVIQGDDGFNDGWWQGRNVHGEVGLFPINYTTPVKPNNSLDETIETLGDRISRLQELPESLPTPSSSSTLAKQHRVSSEQSLSQTKSDYSLDSELSRQSAKPLAAAPSRMTLASKSLEKMIHITLSLPLLQDTSPENWDVSQVVHWLCAMGYESVAQDFQEQEISGDILLELTLDSLKEELNVHTYGKRFKIHCAICALREEVIRQRCIYSMNSSWDSSSINTDDYQSTITQPNGAGSRHKPHRGEFGSVQQLYPENEAMLSDNEFDSRDVPNSRRSRRSNSASAERDSFVEPHKSRRRTHTESSVKQAQSELKSFESMSHSSYLPTTKPQTVLQVATRYSMDSIYHRVGFPENNVAPDMEGWLHKQGDRYKIWNKRWFVLKGPNLFYFKSPKDVRMKGIINLRGYRIVCDETIYPGQYSFKAQHERERTFFFYTETETSMKAWLKALMKSTISRDFNAPVLSSTTIPTVTLDIARRMNPRPPSMLLYKKENKTTKKWLESIADDATSISSEQQQPTLRPLDSEQSMQPITDDSAISSSADTPIADVKEEMQDSGFDSTHKRISQSLSCGPNDDSILNIDSEESGEVVWAPADYVDWINGVTEHTVADLGELRSGDILIELLQSLSGKEVPTSTSDSGSVSMMMLDKLVSAFKFMGREGAQVEGRVTIKDIFGGNEVKIMEMLDCIRMTFETAQLEVVAE